MPIGPIERQVNREAFTRGWLAAVAYMSSHPAARIEQSTQEKVVTVGAALTAAGDDPIELDRVRRQFRLHPYSANCNPGCRTGGRR